VASGASGFWQLARASDIAGHAEGVKLLKKEDYWHIPSGLLDKQ
jgi:hypothetical protein